VQQGEFVALVGANGSGKTTLVKHFNGLLRPRRGLVLIAGRDTASRSIGELARLVGFLFQHPEQQIFAPTVRQELAFGPRNLGLSPAEVSERVDAALSRFGLANLAERPPSILGYGARRRVTLASLAAIDPPILVLDEPNVGLDLHGQEETCRWLVEMHGQGRTVVLVSHDMALVAEYAQRAIVMSEGQILADCPPVELFQQAELLERSALIPPQVVRLGEALRPLGMSARSLTVEAFAQEYISLLRRRNEPAL
jgi:energy-coupling factor transport system ATP-binding protein